MSKEAEKLAAEIVSYLFDDYPGNDQVRRDAVQEVARRTTTALTAARAEGEAERDSILAFFGAALKENGDISINMKKYHAAHFCEKHQLEIVKPTHPIVERCVACFMDAVRVETWKEAIATVRESIKKSQAAHLDVATTEIAIRRLEAAAGSKTKVVSEDEQKESREMKTRTLVITY